MACGVNAAHSSPAIWTLLVQTVAGPLPAAQPIDGRTVYVRPTSLLFIINTEGESNSIWALNKNANRFIDKRMLYNQ